MCLKKVLLNVDVGLVDGTWDGDQEGNDVGKNVGSHDGFTNGEDVRTLVGGVVGDLPQTLITFLNQFNETLTKKNSKMTEGFFDKVKKMFN